MFIAAIKLADIVARSLFVLVVLYSLPARSAGQFGLALTLIGLFAFMSGFERYADIQRRLIGHSDANADRLIFSTLRFWAGNHILFAPLLAALLIWWVDLSPLAALLCLVIAVGEHLSNEVYRIALIVPRHRRVLVAVLLKSSVLFAIVATMVALQGDHFDLGSLLWVWAAMSLFGAAAAGALFAKSAVVGAVTGWREPHISLSEQYRSSRTHFMIGLVALGALQADRLVAGSLLTLEQTGVYFRHILLVSFVYTVFNVVSYNRISARVYAHARAGEPALARRAIHREIKLFIPGTLLLATVVWHVDTAWLPLRPAIQSIVPPYVAILLIGFLVRAVADYNALLLNAVYRERDIFVAQSIALVLAVAFNLVLTSTFGIVGTVCSLVLASGFYLVTSGIYTRRNLELKIAS